MIASIYRHTHNNFNEFFQYLENCLTQVVKENKELYIYRDFNFDVLKIDFLCSYGFLPHTLQPTRATENTATVIDNIFSNNIKDNISCGNILLTLSEHFSKIDLKKGEYILK